MLKLAEDRLGLALFERRGGRLHASPELRTLYPEIERIFDELARAIASFPHDRSELRIQIRSALNYEIADIVMARHAEIGLDFDLAATCARWRSANHRGSESAGPIIPWGSSIPWRLRISRPLR